MTYVVEPSLFPLIRQHVSVIKKGLKKTSPDKESKKKDVEVQKRCAYMFLKVQNSGEITSSRRRTPDRRTKTAAQPTCNRVDFMLLELFIGVAIQSNHFQILDLSDSEPNLILLHATKTRDAEENTK